ncbi:MAG: 50S ribosomal protein L22 [Planctomycetes bacterium]|nr:50S ribosomal protein L22 [Planctomycetota bacterium]
MEYKTLLRYARSTPRKMRYVVDMIRNKPIPEAQRILRYTPKRVSYFLHKLVNSAVANATTRDANLAPENLYISTITVGDGPAFKRWRSGSMGRATQVKKRTSHITLVLKTIQQVVKTPVSARPEAAPKRHKAADGHTNQPAAVKEKEHKAK